MTGWINEGVGLLWASGDQEPHIGIRKLNNYRVNYYYYLVKPMMRVEANISLSNIKAQKNKQAVFFFECNYENLDYITHRLPAARASYFFSSFSTSTV